ncbi:MAG: AMP phosphorylase [Candidatus Aenigmatarchaeota archaeon]
MILKARILEFEAKKPIVILNKADADDLGVKPLDRVELFAKKRRMTAIVNIAEKFIRQGWIGLYGRLQEELQIKEGMDIEIKPIEQPMSILYIKNKLAGKVLRPEQLRQIVQDIVDQKLSEIEMTSFVTALYNHGLTMEEAASLSIAMAETGKVLKLKTGPVFDKHSIGGVPGDKTSILLVPIIASAGLIIPKTSSRSITSAAGTADRMECLAPVELEMEEIKRVVEHTNGCLVWGGAVELAPADDILIQIEYPLAIDPLLLPSVMSKKKAVQAKYLVIDIPTGRGAKIKTIGEANELAGQFIELGKRLDINTKCISTFGEQPLGYCIGPALEAREALETLMNIGKQPFDLIDKVTEIASALLEFKGIRNAREKVRQIIKSGKAEKKLREIIEAQGGDSKIKPDEIPIGDKCAKIKSVAKGRVLWINNHAIATIAREAGAPADKGAGIILRKKLGDDVKEGDVLFEIYAEKNYKLERALKLTEELNVMGIAERQSMLLAKIPEERHKKVFILER